MVVSISLQKFAWVCIVGWKCLYASVRSCAIWRIRVSYCLRRPMLQVQVRKHFSLNPVEQSIFDVIDAKSYLVRLDAHERGGH